MKIFESIYNYVMALADHSLAKFYLYFLSFIESFILPFPPPDVLLAPMSLKRPDQAVFFALGTTVSSVLGGIVGYLIGYFAFEFIEPFIQKWGYADVLETATALFKEWGFWAVLVAGFSPVPYKIFTVSAGLLSLAFLPFVIASIIGRGLRFFLVAMLLAKFGPKIEPVLMKYIERIGWAVVVLLVVLIVYLQFK